METNLNDHPQQNPCGIKKIIDCKVENGQQMYKVKWEPTWEPVENLMTCQHLIDDFWSLVNRMKTQEHIADGYRKRMHILPNHNQINDVNLHSLSTDSKEEIQKLIARSNSIDAPPLISPSNMLTSMQNSEDTKTFTNLDEKPFSNSSNSSNESKNFNTQIMNKTNTNKSCPTSANNSKAIASSSLKYLENFENPYVKIILVCKICNKEQSLKFAGNWKMHYMTHSDEKPYKCPHCTSAFKRSDHLRKHVLAKHKDESEMELSSTQQPQQQQQQQQLHQQQKTPQQQPKQQRQQQQQQQQQQHQQQQPSSSLHLQQLQQQQQPQNQSSSPLHQQQIQQQNQQLQQQQFQQQQLQQQQLQSQQYNPQFQQEFYHQQQQYHLQQQYQHYQQQQQQQQQQQHGNMFIKQENMS